MIGSATEVVVRNEDGQQHRLPSSIRRRAQAIDRHVAARIRGRQVMLGLTQQQLAELIGTTLQQAHKYETGINRVSSGRLYRIAQALDTDVGYFFEEVGRRDKFMPAQQRLLLDLARSFIAIRSRRHQEELVSVARALAEPDAKPSTDRLPRRRLVWPG
jgi:transcriptional regulator with XRE-family HTH domain